MDEVNRLTFPEYELLMKAVRLKQIDKEYELHLQAYLSLLVKAEKKAGKGKSRPVYRNVENNKENKSQFAGIGKFLKK